MPPASFAGDAVHLRSQHPFRPPPPWLVSCLLGFLICTCSSAVGKAAMLCLHPLIQTPRKTLSGQLLHLKPLQRSPSGAPSPCLRGHALHAKGDTKKTHGIVSTALRLRLCLFSGFYWTFYHLRSLNDAVSAPRTSCPQYSTRKKPSVSLGIGAIMPLPKITQAEIYTYAKLTLR